jgi:hypothetical protein
MLAGTWLTKVRSLARKIDTKADIFSMTTFAFSSICLLFFLVEDDKNYEGGGRRGKFCGWLHLCQAQFCGQVVKKENR